MELRNCEYCGTAYDARLSQCPLCGRTAGGQKAPAQPEPKRVRPAAENKPEKIQPTQPDTPARTEKAPAGKRLRQEPGGARAARGYTGKRLRTGAAVPAQDGSDTPEAPKGGNVYAIPKWMMATICVILGLAVLGGALLAFSRLGWSPLYRETTLEAPAQTADTQPETTQPEPAQSAQPAEAASDPAADENRYRNEEDQTPVQTEETSQQPESAACTSLTLSAPTVTFEDAGRFFNITFTRKPAECTEPVTFTSSDENVATVSEQGKIVAVNAGSAVITAACGEQTAQCLVTCDFAYVGAETTVEGSVPLALSKDDLTFFNAGEQYTLSVTGAPEGAKITYVSSDESIATVSSSGVLTAKGSGTTTVSVTVDDNPAMTCIVRCNFEDGAAESGEQARQQQRNEHAEAVDTGDIPGGHGRTDEDQGRGQQRDHQAVFDRTVERVVAEGHTLDIVLQAHEGIGRRECEGIEVDGGVRFQGVHQNDEDRVEIRDGDDREDDRQHGMGAAVFLEAVVFHY